MTLPLVIGIAGCIALLVGLFGGGVKAKEVEVPKISGVPRIFSSIIGLLLIGAALYINFLPPAKPVDSTPVPVTQIPAPTQPPVLQTSTQMIPTQFQATQIGLTQAALIPATSLPITGDWTNVDMSAKGVTRIKISFDGKNYAIETWGKCQPVDCRWNDDPSAKFIVSNVTESTMTVVWVLSYMQATLHLAVQADGRLMAGTFEHFTGDTNQKDSNFSQYFVKSGG